MEGNEVLGQSNKLRDITTVAIKVFGWDKKEKPGVQVNQLIISPDAAEGIREMRSLLEEGGEINAERWTQLNHRIQAGNYRPRHRGTIGGDSRGGSSKGRAPMLTATPSKVVRSGGLR
jgi:hypothetical protein